MSPDSRGTDSRSEQFLTPSSVLSQPALLQGSHGLTWGGAPKAGSRWKLELLASQAGRCQSAGSGTCSIPQHLGRRTSELTSIPHVRQAPKCSLPAWLWRWLLGSGRLALNEVKPQGQSWHPSKWVYALTTTVSMGAQQGFYKSKPVPLFSLWICLNMVLYQSLDLSVFWRKTKAKSKMKRKSWYISELLQLQNQNWQHLKSKLT